MKDNIIQDKSIAFAIRVVNMYKYLCDEKHEYVLSKQFVRAGTSIGANIHEAVNGQSRKDFLSKMYIAFKEATETEYWIKILTSTNYISETESNSILIDCVEIKKILNSIVKTTKSE